MDNNKKPEPNSPKQAEISPDETVRSENPRTRSDDIPDLAPIRDRLDQVRISSERARNTENTATGSDDLSDEERLIRFNRLKASFPPGAIGAFASHHNVNLLYEDPKLAILGTHWLNLHRMPPNRAATLQQSENVNLNEDNTSLNSTINSNDRNVHFDSNPNREHDYIKVTATLNLESDSSTDYNREVQHSSGAFDSYENIESVENESEINCTINSNDGNVHFASNLNRERDDIKGTALLNLKSDSITDFNREVQHSSGEFASYEHIESMENESVNEDNVNSTNNAKDEDLKEDLKRNTDEDRDKTP